MLFVLERCVPQAERDVPFGRDVAFGSDVRFAREDAKHITSLCAKGATHHYGEAITSLCTPQEDAFYSRQINQILQAFLWAHV